MALNLQDSLNAAQAAGLGGVSNADLQRLIAYLLCQVANNGGGGTTVQAGVKAIALNASTGTVTFPTAFTSAPVVVCNVVDTGNVQNLTSNAVAITATGFTFNISSPAESANCALHWHATLPS